jgi:uncharacterized protein (TIGR02453 family)
MAFGGWPAEALEFYEGLEADNSRIYWTTNRPAYDELVLAPMTELLTELAPEFGEWKIFRPYRDVRFSADKTPYKTAIGARIGAGYVQLSADGLAAGAGCYRMDPDQLRRYRAAVADDIIGSELEAVVKTVTKKGIEVRGQESLKTAPRGYPADHPRLELLRHKGLIAWREWEPAAWLGTVAARKRVVDFLRGARPLIDWLEANAGDSEPGRG